MHEPIEMSVRARLTKSDRKFDDLLDIAKSKAPDPSVFDEVNPFFWTAEISNNKIDFYWTSMAITTLQNFVDGLNDGVSYQDSHDARTLGYGQSIYGEIEKRSEKVDIVGEPLVAVLGTFFALPDVDLALGKNTNGFIKAIRSGMYRDVSVGFAASDIVCSICGKQSFHWWEEDGCTHIPGVDYAVGEKGAKTETAWAQIMDGRLLETSQVYDGATPDAKVHQVIMKAEALAAERMIEEREIAQAERRFHTRIRRAAPLFAIGDIPAGQGAVLIDAKEIDMTARKNKGRSVDDEEQIVDPVEEAVVGEPTDDLEADNGELPVPVVADDDDSAILDDSDDDSETVIELGSEEVAAVSDDAPATAPEVGERSVDILADERRRLESKGIRLGTDPVKAVKTLADTVLEQHGRITELTDLADIGRQYRADLITETLAEGVKARGASFKREFWAGLTERMTLDEIKAVREDFRDEAVRNLKPAASVDEADPIATETPEKKRQPRSSAAYKAY